MKWGKYLLLLLIAVSVHFVVGEEEPATPGAPEEGENIVEEFPWQSRTSALTVATLLIVLSIIFELAKDKIEETTSEELKPVVDHLFQELTVLGFLSLLTFLLVQAGAQAGNPISDAIFAEEDFLSEMIEYIHMGLFLVLIVFIVEVILLIRLGEREKKKWEEGEEYATKHPERLCVNYQKAMKKRGGQDKFIWKLLPFLNPSVHHEENMNYFAMRKEFISPRDATKPRLPKDFNFNMYLSICMGEVLGELVEISIRTWAVLWLFFVVVYAVSYLPILGIEIIYFLFGWALLAWMAIIAMQLNRIKLWLAPRANLSSTVNEGSALLADDQFSPPRFLKLSLQRRTAIGRLVYGTPANKHQLLFPANTKGPAVLVFMVRLIILLSAIYLSFLLFICLQAPEWWYILIEIPLAFLPILILGFFYTPKVLRIWVLVCNVEMLKNQEAVNKVLRTQKTAKSLKTLKVIQLMKFKTRRSSPKDQEQAVGQVRQLSELPPEKVESIREVFKLFDIDGSGNIDLRELVQVFGTLGQEISDLEARELIAELDKDGDGELSFEEFAEYFQQTLDMETEDPEETIKNMFSIFDRNNDGDISTGEFIAILQKLGSSLSMDDIQAVVDEVDKDGDGEISLEEFESLIRKHLLEEKKKKK